MSNEIPKGINLSEVTNLELAIYPARQNSCEEESGANKIKGKLVITSGNRFNVYDIAYWSTLINASTSYIKLEGVDEMNLTDPVPLKETGLWIKLNPQKLPGIIIRGPDYQLPEKAAQQLQRYPEYGYLISFHGNNKAGWGADFCSLSDRKVKPKDLNGMKVLVNNS